MKPTQQNAGVRAGGQTDIGLRRQTNEDVYLISVERGFFLVADGMGGAAAGELASLIFKNAAISIISGDMRRSEKQAVSLVKNTFALAGAEIIRHVASTPDDAGMGCTAELLLLHAEGFVIGHVGDSRTYRLRRNELKQLTKDHSLVQQQIQQGLITEEEARTHSMRNVILRALGTNRNLLVDIVKGPVIRGDLFMLCSDGLTDMIDDRTIRKVLLSRNALNDKVAELIQAAKKAGGKDNITTVLIEVLA